MDLMTVYPFLLGLFDRHGDDCETWRRFLTTSSPSLCWTTRVPAQYKEATIGSSSNCLKRSRVERAAWSRGFGRSSSRSDAEVSRWPDDAEFRDAWMTTPVFRVMVQARVRMLLEALENRLRSSKSEQLTFREKLTIEHLLPRSWEQHWPLPPDVDDGEGRETRRVLLQTIGNLTLLTNRLNPSVSNGPWRKKKPNILRHSALTLNRDLQEHEEWDEAAIRARGASLFKVARRIWPFPG